MDLKIFGSDWIHRISGYSIVPNLLYDIVAMTPKSELLPWEKLFVVNTIGQPTHRGYLADIYLSCGCFGEARKIYSKPEHPRKLGDICWCEGALDDAEAFYSNPKSEAQPYRTSPDYDRLIKLAFYREQWHRVLTLFARSDISGGFSAGCVLMGRSEVSSQAYLELLAATLANFGTGTPPEIFQMLTSYFNLRREEWVTLLAEPRWRDEKTLMKLKKRCRPKVGAEISCTLEQAVEKGNTPRAQHVAKYIEDADASLERTQAVLQCYAQTGNESELEEFLFRVTGSGVRSISQSFLFSALGHNSFKNECVPPARLIRLFSSHPAMNKRHFGDLLHLRFTHQVPLTVDDLITGLFQWLGRNTFASQKKEEVLDIVRLASCREWARVRLEEWLQRKGTERIEQVATTWREGKAAPAPHPFYAGVIESPESPRNMQEWNDLMDRAHSWLTRRWALEIGASPWVSENQLFQIVRRSLKGTEVIQHARPTWLEPQHLDIYVPEVGIAVEYMGRQHFESLEFFGGEEAFRAVQGRDHKKIALCEASGVELISVRFDEDLGQRAREIVTLVKSRLRRP